MPKINPEEVSGFIHAFMGARVDSQGGDDSEIEGVLPYDLVEREDAIEMVWRKDYFPKDAKTLVYFINMVSYTGRKEIVFKGPNGTEYKAGATAANMNLMRYLTNLQSK